MGKKQITYSEKEIDDLSKGLIFAMKELDKYTMGSDKLLADRLEVILKKIQSL